MAILSTTRSRRNFFFCASMLSLSACNPFHFDDLEDEAPVVIGEAPGSYPRIDFGTYVSATHVRIDNDEHTRLVATAGSGSPFTVFDAWNGASSNLDPALYSGCANFEECGQSVGGNAVAIGKFREFRLCVVAPAPEDSLVTVNCETQVGKSETLMSPMAERVGASSAALPTDSALGVALLGAPAGGATGKIYALSTVGAFTALDLTAAGLESGAGAGAQLAVATANDGTVWVVTGTSSGRVIVGTAKGDASTFQVRSCLSGVPFPSDYRIAAGDLTGDGLPEIVVTRSFSTDPSRVVEVYDGKGLPASAGCALWGAGPQIVQCPEALEGVACDSAEFAASVTTGDVDGDGTHDLIVGAPGAAIDGVAEAGAVYLFRGTSTGPSVLESERDLLTTSSPKSGARLGASVTAVRTRNRDEPAAGAPGQDFVAVFFCSTLDGDTPAVGTRCLPQP